MIIPGVAKTLWSQKGSLRDIDRIANEVVAIVQNKQSFTIWLSGELGAGKTTFAATLLKKLGLKEEIPVLSPTFTYVNEYQIKGRKFLHLDLYRLPDGDVDSVDSLFYGEMPVGKIVEWAERAPNSDSIAPTHVFNIEIIDCDARNYSLVEIND